MFETAETGIRISKEFYKNEVPKIREELLEIQKKLALSNNSAIVIIGGVEGAGKSEVVNQLLEWLDARGIETFAFDSPTDEERERPYMWRFFRKIPAKGRMAIMLGSWYTELIVNKTFKRIKKKDFEKRIDEIVSYERMLTKEGVIIIKFWLHIKKDLLLKRMKKIESDPLQSFRINKMEWKYVKKFDKFRKVSELVLGETNQECSSFNIVEAYDYKYRNLEVAKNVVSSIREGIKSFEKREKPPLKARSFKPPENNIFKTLDYTKKIDDKDYEDKLIKLQAELHKSVKRMAEKKKSLIVVFEGPDAAGKGGAIRRIIKPLDAKDYRVISISAPTDEEKARPYLWRFWRELPKRGNVTIYDRSWYGRVLVEKIEGFCSDDEWKRSYSEINQFEKELNDFEITIIKFYLSITQEEQLKRFKERQTTPYKQYKITEEDWRNRGKWNSYEACAIEMFEKTSTPYAPWIVVPANDKNFARIEVLKNIIKKLK